jgi:hypothetical protein
MEKRIKAKQARWLSRNAFSRATNQRGRLRISDERILMEGSNAFEAFIEAAGKRAAANAINENKALGIPVTFIKDGWVVRRMPDGHIEKIKQVAEAAGRIRERKLRKGMILHVKKTTR